MRHRHRSTRRRPWPSGGDGFSIAETLVALGVIGVVCASLALLVVRSISLDNHQAQRRTAVQAASAALERVNQLAGDAILTLPASEDVPDMPGFTEAFEVRACWQVDAGSCTDVTTGSTNGLRKLYRITVTITWAGRQCTGGQCSYVVHTLVSPTQDDPTFA